MAKIVLEGPATLVATDATRNAFASTVKGEIGFLEVRASENLYPGKHFAVLSLASGAMMKTSCGTMERPDENTVVLRDTVGGHTYEFELLDN